MQKLQVEKKVVPFPAKKRYGWKQLGTIAAAVLVVVAAGGVKGMLEMRSNQNEAMQQIAVNPTKTAKTGENTLYTLEEMSETQSLQEQEAEKQTFPTQETPKASAEEKNKAGAEENKTSQSTEESADTAQLSTSEEMQSIAPKAVLQADLAESATGYPQLRTANAESIDSVTLLVEDTASALRAIRASIADCGGYEESTIDDTVQAVLPAINYQAFLEQIGKLGELQELCQSEEEDAPRTIRISIAGK